MLEFFERHRLIKKGLASTKTRRRRSTNEWTQALETNVWVKTLIFLGFIAGLGMLIYASPQPQPMEIFLVALLIFFTALAQLWINHPRTFAKNSRVLLMFGIFLVHLAGTKMMFGFSRGAGSFGMQEVWKLLIPYAFAPLVCSVLLGRNHGIYAAVFVSLWGSLLFRGIDPVFLVMSLISGFIAVFVTLQVRRRSRLIRAGLFVGLATWALAIIFPNQIMIIWEALGANDWQMIGWQSLAAIGSGVICAMIVGGFCPSSRLASGSPPTSRGSSWPT